MKFRISTSYNWYQTDSERFIVKVYYMNGIEFTFDELPKIAQQDPEMITIADDNPVYTPEIFFRKSFYLIDEECHPCLFPVDLENPEDMPDEIIYNNEEEDLTS
jgi:hypothetical protein